VDVAQAGQQVHIAGATFAKQRDAALEHALRCKEIASFKVHTAESGV